MNESSDFEKRVQQTVEHIANHPPFTAPLGFQHYPVTTPQYWAGDPNYLTQWVSPICPHCGKCRYCGR